MFKVSKALKITAWILCFAFAAVAIGMGLIDSIILWGDYEFGIPIFAGGCLLGWLSFITLYGFGVLVEKAEMDLAVNKDKNGNE